MEKATPLPQGWITLNFKYPVVLEEPSELVAEESSERIRIWHGNPDNKQPALFVPRKHANWVHYTLLAGLNP